MSELVQFIDCRAVITRTGEKDPTYGWCSYIGGDKIVIEVFLPPQCSLNDNYRIDVFGIDGTLSVWAVLADETDTYFVFKPVGQPIISAPRERGRKRIMLFGKIRFENDEVLDCRVIDLSLSGIAFKCERPISAGTKVTVFDIDGHHGLEIEVAPIYSTPLLNEPRFCHRVGGQLVNQDRIQQTRLRCVLNKNNMAAA